MASERRIKRAFKVDKERGEQGCTEEKTVVKNRRRAEAGR
jgi:hypothetical protein